MSTTTDEHSNPQLTINALAKPLLSEIALAVCINGISQAVMMVSDNDLEDFAIGFALSEGFIYSMSDIRDVSVTILSQGKQVNLTVSAQAEYQLKRRKRILAGPTGCGLCGIESINEAMTVNSVSSEFNPVSRSPSNQVSIPQTEIITAAKAALNHLQHQYNGIRGNHCAAYFDLNGHNLGYREDVGRHSALDKLIGNLMKNKTKELGFVMLSSRCSHDLVVKTTRVKLPILVTLAQPTVLAVNSALQAGLILFSFHQGKLKRFA